MGLASLASGCPQLHTLNLEDCQRVTDAGLVSLAAGCPNLNKLTLDSCVNVTDTDLGGWGSPRPTLSPDMGFLALTS